MPTLLRALPLTLAWVLLASAPASALTADEVIRLRGAGVSDETIQKMLEQEKMRSATPPASSPTQPAAAPGSPAPGAAPAAKPPAASVVETADEVIYRAGQNVPEDIRRMERQEQERERRNQEMLRNVIIDTRTPPPPRGAGQDQAPGQAR